MQVNTLASHITLCVHPPPAAFFCIIHLVSGLSQHFPHKILKTVCAQLLFQQAVVQQSLSQSVGQLFIYSIYLKFI